LPDTHSDNVARSRYDAQRRCRCAAEVQDAIGIIDGRWKMMILAHLHGEETMRFSDLQRAIPRISQKMLIQQLRGLESDGVISRAVYPEVPPKVEYRLTEVGKHLGPVFMALLDWAEILRASRGAEDRPEPASPDRPVAANKKGAPTKRSALPKIV
jgi:DNA-binding HxlR family transcriptional regulator